MVDLFSPVQMGSMRLPNRFVRSATHDFMAEPDGSVSDREVTLIGNLASGGVGLIVVGHAYVRQDGKCSPGMLGLDSDDKVAGYARLVESVRRASVSQADTPKIVAQINFGGAQIPAAMRGSELLAPSEREDVPEARAFSEKEAADLVTAYVDAAQRAREAGVDGVQLHTAHGYFLNQTLSPLTNHRTDRYGGSIEGRAEFLKQVVVGVRERLGSEYPLIIKIAAHDGTPDGLTLADSVEAARLAVQGGVDGVEVSGGMRRGMNMRRPLREPDEGFFLEEAAAFKEGLKVPIISVHGFRSLKTMEQAVRSSNADLISLCRPLIREPDLVNRFRTGVQDRSTCISCNTCLKRGDEGLRCWAER